MHSVSRVLLQQVEPDIKNVWCHDTEALWRGAVPDNCNIDTKVWRPASLSSHQIMVHIVIGQWQEFCFVQDIPRIMLDTIDNMWYIFNQWLSSQLIISEVIFRNQMCPARTCSPVINIFLKHFSSQWNCSPNTHSVSVSRPTIRVINQRLFRKQSPITAWSISALSLYNCLFHTIK